MDRNPKLRHGSALDKAMAILEAVTSSPAPIALPELSDRLGLPRQTVHRVLNQLCQSGLLKRARERERYTIGPRLSRLATSTIVAANHDAPVRAVLQDLVSDINETCNIGVLDGLDFVYLERIESEWPLRVHLQAGSRVPAYCTSGGKALLAHLETRTRRRLLTSIPLQSYTSSTVTDLKQLAREFDTCRQVGFAVNEEEFTPGIVGVAVPIVTGNSQTAAALACHAPSARISVGELKQHIPAMKAAASRLGQIWSDD